MKKFIFAIFVFSSIHSTQSSAWSYNFSGTIHTSISQIGRSIGIGREKIAQSLNTKPFWKNPSATTKVVSLLGLAAGASYALYSYFTRFNLKDAHSLINHIHEVITHPLSGRLNICEQPQGLPGLSAL